MIDNKENHITTKCEIKGCMNISQFIWISHEIGDKYICQECHSKYLVREQNED